VKISPACFQARQCQGDWESGLKGGRHMMTKSPARGANAESLFMLPENGMKLLALRYLRKDDTGSVMESPEDMLRRVAVHVAKGDAAYEGGRSVETTTRTFFEVLRNLEFLPNSPTLMNAGRDLQQLSSCFVLPLEDSLDSIFEAVKHAALIHKSGGGSGFSFSRIRPRGDKVGSTHGVSSGPVSFMDVFDTATSAVRQGGTRRGANMGVLRVDHPDILDFVDAKAGKCRLENFNLSVAVSDAFMQDAAAGRCYTLIHPRNGRAAGSLNAAEVMRRISLRAWEEGEPGILFMDTINRHNPLPEQGIIECTNPCGEQPLLPYESCCLGSVNLARMTMRCGSGTRVAYKRLAQVVRTGVRFLDNVIDVNRYPLPQIAEVTRRNRKIGLGVMGWSDLLIRLGIPYASGQALALADKIMGFIQRTARHESAALARMRGPYLSFRDIARGGCAPLRNATVTTIAPTGSIALIAGCSSGIEPPFALSHHRKHSLDGAELREIHPLLLQELSARNLDRPAILEAVAKNGSVQGVIDFPDELRPVYASALEIAAEWHVRLQAAFQRHCDNAVSKTVNLPFQATPQDVQEVFVLAHSLGCKGITVYRDRSREAQVLNVGCAGCA
jgi:ribonucleoside-diphosphate reductase alpha chain